MAAPFFVVVAPRVASAWSPPSPTSGTETKAQGFPRAVRLRKSSDFRRIQEQGRRVRQAHLLVVYLPATQGSSRFGLTVSRKVGNAVVRNRVKRWLREAIRRERASSNGRWDVVFIAHPSAADAGADVLRAQVRAALGRVDGRAR